MPHNENDNQYSSVTIDQEDVSMNITLKKIPSSITSHDLFITFIQALQGLGYVVKDKDEFIKNFLQGDV